MVGRDPEVGFYQHMSTGPRPGWTVGRGGLMSGDSAGVR